ncbi:MAG: tagatose-bisphosphate aldolase subunit GatY [Halanaerobiales bacterium]|nr:tagatose-bisphosphate aldolase subunit GatY [Halanaerobiales bacterium]
MPLVNPLPILKKARQQKLAIAAFNIHNLETMQAVVEGAVEEMAPVIIQTTPGTLEHAGIPFISAMAKAAAEEYRIPIILHLDHCSSFAIAVKCIRYGYTSVMIDGSALPYQDNIKLVAEVVKVAQAAGIAVEGELGRIGGTEDDITVDEREAAMTVPGEALDFVQRTGIDTLAVAIGTAHGLYKGEPLLDFDRLAQIKELVDIPLVLHGASGVPDDSIIRSINRGICKVNIATELKIPLAEAIKNSFKVNPAEDDPRNYLGAGREEVKKVVKRKIRLTGASKLLKR